jgi:hypothetical protein
LVSAAIARLTFLQRIVVDDHPRTLAARCKECGAVGPRSVSDDPAHAVTAWNQRQGRLSVVK